MLAALLIAAATPAAPLEPRGKWLLEAEPDQCILSHAFGPAAVGDVIVALHPFPLSERMQLIVLMKNAMTPREVVYGTAAIVVSGRDRPEVTGRYLSSAVKDGPGRLIKVTTARAALDGLADDAVLTVTLSSGGRRSEAVMLRIPPMAKALLALSQCERALLDEWGFDRDPPPVAVAATPRGSLSRYFSPNVYPQSVMNDRVIGQTFVALQLDAGGSVERYRVSSTAGKALADASCAAIRRAQFNPATDAAGRPVRSIYTTVVSWQMEP